ncbi:hypothetical protein SKAU_G00269830 [Synaphobranchus kaupii]|uniref:Uncharacterized protein n=1 Tax=Synaphobranchus kaupii TaxID=118154 RepID=A0A9Q1F0D2_SYNKA|nr:hypothetical protein SKAU_G00269830 [Synaphobranchus kaupii]
MEQKDDRVAGPSASSDESSQPQPISEFGSREEEEEEEEEEDDDDDNDISGPQQPTEPSDDNTSSTNQGLEAEPRCVLSTGTGNGADGFPGPRGPFHAPQAGRAKSQPREIPATGTICGGNLAARDLARPRSNESLARIHPFLHPFCHCGNVS